MVHNPPSGLRWVQWVNADLAAAWRRECELRLRTAAPEASIAANVAEQAAATAALWEAVYGFLAACDLPYQIFVPYVRAVTITAPTVWRAELVTQLRRHSPDFVANEAEVNVSMRLQFAAGAVNRSWLVSLVAPTPTQGLDYQRTGFTSVDASIWGAWVWSEWYPGAGRAEHFGAVQGLQPMRESYELGREMAGWIAGRSVESSVNACRNYAALKNLQTAHAIAPGALPSEVNVLLARTLSADQLLTDQVSPGLATVAAVGAAASSALGPFASVAALVVGLLAGLGATLQSVFGTAVGYSVDAFGRRQPVLEKTFISGSLAPRAAPTHDVPIPPRFLRPIVLIPIEGGGAPIEEPGAEGGGGGGGSGGGSSKSSAAKVGAVAFFLWLVSNSRK